MMETKGKISHRLIKKATFGEMHFDESNNFISIERDKITGQVSTHSPPGPSAFANTLSRVAS